MQIIRNNTGHDARIVEGGHACGSYELAEPEHEPVVNA